MVKYEDDFIRWSLEQADLLDQFSETPTPFVANQIDWENIAYCLRDRGISDVYHCRRALRTVLTYLLCLHCWPGHPSCPEWTAAIALCVQDVADAYTPAMSTATAEHSRAIDIDALYAGARRVISVMAVYGEPAFPAPDSCPWSLEYILDLGGALHAGQ